MSQNTSSLMLLFGHCHLLLVHLPIGGLVLLGFLELLSFFPRWGSLNQNSLWILGFTCAMLLGSTAAGWTLALTGEYDPQLLKWHRGLGLALTAACLFTFLLRRWRWLWFYRASLCTTLILLLVTGHLGGSISFGSDFLTHYYPVFVKKLLRQSTAGGATKLAEVPAVNQAVFAGFIEPIFQQRCCVCHGPEKHKADLRLDTVQQLLRGGQDGLVIKAGDGKDSPLVQCMMSPLDSDGHMPPENHPQATAEEIALIEWWIDMGASATESLSDLKPNPEIQRLLCLVSNRIGPAKPSAMRQ